MSRRPICGALPGLLFACLAGCHYWTDPALRVPQAVAAQGDSLVVQARAAGRTAAEREVTWPFFGLAIVPGAALGFFTAIAVGEGFAMGDAETGLAAAGAAGLLLTLGLAHWTAVPPRPGSPLLAGRPPEYQRAFREAYVERVRQRRSRAVLWGGLTGPAIGLGFLVLVLASWD